MTFNVPMTQQGASRRFLALAASTAMLVAAGVLAAAPVAAVTATPYNSNLVKNRGFEAGSASVTGTTVVAVPSWSTTGNATVVKYGTAGGFPTIAEGLRISGGKQFLTSGVATAPDECGEAEQIIMILGRSAAIDSGHVLAKVKGRLGTYGAQPDTAIVGVSFLDATGGYISSFELPTRTATNGRLLLSSAGMILPAGTRRLQLILSAINTVGYCDAYFDKISAKLVYV